LRLFFFHHTIASPVYQGFVNNIAAGTEVMYNIDVYITFRRRKRMKRTQIYLQESQKTELEKLAVQKSKSLAELIREAVDLYIANSQGEAESHILAAGGIWKDREDINPVEYVRSLREETVTRLTEGKR
jgi:predicted DNA-binding protein